MSDKWDEWETKAWNTVGPWLGDDGVSDAEWADGCPDLRKRIAKALRDATAMGGVMDDPTTDGTDAAHPAWWRGQEDGTKGACEVIQRALDGDTGGECSEPLESLRRKCHAMVKELLRVSLKDE